MTDTPFSYDDLVNLASSMPRIPQRRLKCHPSVVVALRASEGPVPAQTEWPYQGQLEQDLLSIPIKEDSKLAFGEWRIFEDGRCVAAGFIMPGNTN